MLSEQGVALTPYQETEHFTLMKHFVNHPEHVLHYLFQEDENEETAALGKDL